MSIRLFQIRRSAHFSPTTKRGVAGALAAAGVGLVAAVGGLLVTATHDDPPVSGVRVQAALPIPEGTSVPPTMVLIPETTTTQALTPGHAEIIRELGAVLRGLHAAARVAGSEPVSPNAEALATYATGEALTEIRDQLAAQQDEGLARRVSRAGRLSTVQIVSGKISGRTATVVACEIDTDELYEINTGTTIDDEVIVRDITVNFVKTTGGWKITKVSFDPDDADGCSASAG
jgi:hypothetical protein